MQETFDMLSEAERPGSLVYNFARCKFEALTAAEGDHLHEGVLLCVAYNQCGENCRSQLFMHAYS